MNIRTWYPRSLVLYGTQGLLAPAPNLQGFVSAIADEVKLDLPRATSKQAQRLQALGEAVDAERLLGRAAPEPPSGVPRMAQSGQYYSGEMPKTSRLLH